MLIAFSAVLSVFVTHTFLTSDTDQRLLQRFDLTLEQMRAFGDRGDFVDAFRQVLPAPPRPSRPEAGPGRDGPPRGGGPAGPGRDGPPAPIWNLIDPSGESYLPSAAQMASIPTPTDEERAELPTTPGKGVRINRRLIVGMLDDRHFLVFDPTPDEAKRRVGLYWITVGVVLCTLLASLSTLLFLIYGLRSKGRLADQVIDRLKKGDIKARFPIQKLDETGKLMASFNSMADHIETLIAQIRRTERDRIEKLQEIGHDLRTPIAGLQTLIDALTVHAEKLDPAKRSELLGQCAQETAYMADLADNLLYLAIIETPNALQLDTEVDPLPILRSVCAAILNKRERIQFSVEGGEGEPFFIRSHPQVLQRLFRNVLENMSSFAKSGVTVRLSREAEVLTILFEDDGPGYPESILKDFGSRRFHTGKDQPQGRLSLGLGSIIIRSLMAAHGGDASVANRVAANGEILGSRLTLRFG